MKEVEGANHLARATYWEEVRLLLATKLDDYLVRPMSGQGLAYVSWPDGDLQLTSLAVSRKTDGALWQGLLAPSARREQSGSDRKGPRQEAAGVTESANRRCIMFNILGWAWQIRVNQPPRSKL